MSEISKNKDHFFNALAEIAKDKKQLEIFLKIILTPGEWQEVQNRWNILCMLDEGISQRSIAEKVGTGIATITRGSREWKNMDASLKKFLKK